jgi:hypothetical protein
VVTQRDVRRIALSLPGTSEDPEGFRFLVEGKMFVWLWPERVTPKGARVANPDVIVVRVIPPCSSTFPSSTSAC